MHNLAVFNGNGDTGLMETLAWILYSAGYLAVGVLMLFLAKKIFDILTPYSVKCHDLPSGTSRCQHLTANAARRRSAAGGRPRR